MSVGYVCTREVVILDAEASIREAARLMRKHHVGTIVVVEKVTAGLRPVGILTDRDIVVQAVALEVGLEEVTVGDLMSTDLLVALETDDVPSTMERMKKKGVRRTPVVDGDGCLVGIVTADDLIEFLASQITDLAGVIAREQKLEAELRA
ncbi:MAG: CBS domain-containing protein [Thermodesulfobacteriota bacterium]